MHSDDRRTTVGIIRGRESWWGEHFQKCLVRRRVSSIRLFRYSNLHPFVDTTSYPFEVRAMLFSFKN